MPFSVLYMPTMKFALLAIALGKAQGQSTLSTETFTQNAICRQNNCINPLFPGLHDMPRLGSLVWQCSTQSQVADYMDFCKSAVRYDPALPSPSNTSQLVSTLVRAQDDAAATMFFYHLQGMGYESWDHQKPDKASDPCIKTVWELSCYTYFPRAQAGCQGGQASPYVRPCMSSCESYLSQCQIECCDESPQCVFSTMVKAPNGTSLFQKGYVDAVAPSESCTGLAQVSGGRGLSAPLLLLLGIFGLHVAAGGAEGAPAAPAASERRRGRGHFGQYFLAAALLVCAVFLQGCDLSVPEHSVGNWRRKPNYLVSFEFTKPGQSAINAQLNSCTATDVSDTLVCSGKGYCKAWNAASPVEKPLAFCSCERDWTGPECNVRRKSQVTTFLLSLFLGWLGIDYFYLGYVWWAILKLFTLGGLGLWWLVDIVRTGSGAVYAHNYRVAADLPHWVYVLVTISIFMMVGFWVAIESYLSFRKKKRDDSLKLAEYEESPQQLPKMDELDGPRFRTPGGSRSFDGRREFSGYGATIPMPHPNANAPYPGQGSYVASSGMQGMRVA